MDQIKESINFNQVIQIDLLNFAAGDQKYSKINLTKYNKTSKTLSNQNNFSRIFILLCLTTTIIITIANITPYFIIEELVLLSIVRFRV